MADTTIVTADDLDERFWSKVEFNVGPHGCHEWTAKKLPSGRGRFWFRGRWVYPYQLTCEVENGPKPFDEAIAGHTVCDNPKCVRGDHMKWQTQSVNIAECHAKGRHPRSSASAARERQRDAAMLAYADMRYAMAIAED